ncbi:unnamed protein product [Clonostachys byssicola]|uniref:Cytochrome P450 n=1 Tax=Clonostachys byssicola TaxID=160290 RepID=A0A9N9UE04_9HYPO|nr:unnamed protein product [Clonostachys byssicola]
MKLGNLNMFLLNDPTVIRDLLEKRSNNYSCRPDLYARQFGDNLNIALRDNDEIWRRQRKMYHVRLNVKSADRYLPYQHCDSLQLLDDIVDRPDAWLEHIQRYTASISTTLLYGWRTPHTNTGYVKDLLEWMEVTSDALNFQLVDFYPSLRILYKVLPGWVLPNKRKLQNLQKLENRVFYDLLGKAKEKLESGEAHPSFIRDMLMDQDHDRLDDRQIANNAAHGFGAAMDTSANTLVGFIKAMVMFPDVQAKAQEEIDAVIGSDRLPQWDDRDRLPYIRAVVEETFRWAPSPISAAVPHAAKEDDVYNGMVIPKGSMMMINVWTVNHDRFPNARDFDPTRYTPESTLVENNSISQDSPRRMHFTFGAGRRVCPGFHVAERNIFIAVSRLLWGFNFQRARDASGKIIPINRDAVTPGLIVRPEDFECTIKVRSKSREEFIRKSWSDAQENLDSEGNFTPEFIKASFK